MVSNESDIQWIEKKKRFQAFVKATINNMRLSHYEKFYIVFTISRKLCYLHSADLEVRMTSLKTLYQNYLLKVG